MAVGDLGVISGRQMTGQKNTPLRAETQGTVVDIQSCPVITGARRPADLFRSV